MYVANYSRTFSFIKELFFNDDCLMLTFSNFILLSNCAHFSVDKYLDDPVDKDILCPRDKVLKIFHKTH